MSVQRTFVPRGSSILLPSWFEGLRDYYPWCEMQTKRFFVENIESDWVFLDAGASIGYHSILLAQLAQGGKEISLELTPTAVEHLQWLWRSTESLTLLREVLRLESAIIAN